jgi:hypothetical protein
MRFGKILILIQKKKDFSISGEIGRHLILKSNGRRLVEFKSNLSELSRFWNANNLCRFEDHDGLILGNKICTTYKATIQIR